MRNPAVTRSLAYIAHELILNEKFQEELETWLSGPAKAAGVYSERIDQAERTLRQARQEHAELSAEKARILEQQ